MLLEFHCCCAHEYQYIVLCSGLQGSVKGSGHAQSGGNPCKHREAFEAWLKRGNAELSKISSYKGPLSPKERQTQQQKLLVRLLLCIILPFETSLGLSFSWVSYCIYSVLFSGTSRWPDERSWLVPENDLCWDWRSGSRRAKVSLDALQDQITRFWKPADTTRAQGDQE